MLTIRKAIPFVLATLFLVFSVHQFMANAFSDEWRNPSDEMVTKWEDRVQGLRDALPSDVRRVGYLDDSILSNDPSSFDANEFQLMQYSLAPVVLEVGLGKEWLIGNFNKEKDLEVWLDAQLGTYELQGFGFGLYLIHDVEN